MNFSIAVVGTTEREMKTTKRSRLGQWLENRCKQEHLSVREAAAKCGLSHTTLHDIIKRGIHPYPRTLEKLAKGFARGESERLVLEDKFLILTGYMMPRRGEKLNEPLAQFVDKVRGFNEEQIKVMMDFADYLQGIGRRYR